MNDTFDFDVYEGAASLISLQFIITDADFGVNSNLTFNKSGLACEMFSLDSSRLDEHTVSEILL